MKKSEYKKLPKLIFEKCFNESRATSTSIVTVFNQQDIIKNVLEALVISTSMQADLIIIDDGSEDLSLDEISRAINEIEWNKYPFSRIKVYANSHSRFEVFCDNFGVKIAQTEYAILIQADVLITEYGFDRIFLSALKSSPDMLMVSGRGTEVLLPIAKQLSESSGSTIPLGRIYRFAQRFNYLTRFKHKMRVLLSIFLAIAALPEIKLYSVFRRNQRSKTVINDGTHEARPHQSEFSITGKAGYLGHHAQSEESNFGDKGIIWVSQTVMRGPLCIDRSKLIECGGLNTESYFLAFDEHDLSLRAYLKYKYRVGYVPIGYRSNPNWGTTRKKRSFRQIQLALYESFRILNYQKATDLYSLSDSSSLILPAPQIRNFDIFK